jgi:hypothetical protein
MAFRKRPYSIIWLEVCFWLKNCFLHNPTPKIYRTETFLFSPVKKSGNLLKAGGKIVLSESNKLDGIVVDNEIINISNFPEGYSGEEEDPGLLMSVILHVSAILFPLLFCFTVYYSLIHLNEKGLIWSLLFSFPVSWIAADFITGIVHWLCDTYGSIETPILGPGFIRNFRSHHRYPKDLTISPFVYTIGYVALLSLLTLPVAIILLVNYPASFSISFLSFTYAFITLWTVLTNQFHKWAHSDKPYGWVSYLQKNNIILKPSHHQLHHTVPFNSNYCITHGWTNPFLEKIKFFRRTEFLLAKLGMKPTN